MSKPGSMIRLKNDNRYKDGNVVEKGGVLRGNSKTMALKHLVIPLARLYAYNYEYLKLNLNPPIVISEELSKAIKGKL